MLEKFKKHELKETHTIKGGTSESTSHLNFAGTRFMRDASYIRLRF